MNELVIGFVLAAVVGVVGWIFKALSPSGVFGAILVGGLVFGFGGPTWGAVLIVFFLSSSLLSFFRANAKSDAASELAKTSRRDLGQVLANGGLAAILAGVVGIVSHESPWYPTLTLAYFGALSAATADTWATEIGILSTQTPVLIATREPVPAGRSGGVTRLGLVASLMGGLFIGLSAFTLIQLASLLTTGEWFLQDWFLLPVCALAGFIGSGVDSLIGARGQRLNYCDHCQTPTERTIHTCGTPTRYLRGVRWLENDGVNFLATFAGAFTAALASLSFL